MNDEAGKGEHKDSRTESRRDRLKLALRENLKRRKAQARGRGETAPRSDDMQQDEEKPE
jgi:hypothetical protein